MLGLATNVRGQYIVSGGGVWAAFLPGLEGFFLHFCYGESNVWAWFERGAYGLCPDWDKIGGLQEFVFYSDPPPLSILVLIKIQIYVLHFPNVIMILN